MNGGLDRARRERIADCTEEFDSGGIKSVGISGKFLIKLIVGCPRTDQDNGFAHMAFAFVGVNAGELDLIVFDRGDI